MREHGLRQSQLADYSGIAATQLTRYFGNKERPSIKSMLTLDEAMGDLIADTGG